MRLCLLFFFWSFAAFAAEKKRPQCQNVYRIIENAGRGFVHFHTELDFTPTSVIAAGEEAFAIGETTRDIVEGLKDRLAVLEKECGPRL